MKRHLVASAALFSLLLFQGQALGQQKQISQKQSAQMRGDQVQNDKVVRQKFAKIQNDMKRGKGRFIGKKPTFKIAPNPILRYPLKAVTGDLIPRNIERVAREQRKIAKAKLAVEQEFIKAAVAKGALKYPQLAESCSTRASRFDWRRLGKVTPVKNQGGCGSCTTFATTGAFEGSYAVRNNVLLDSSEQHLLSCTAVNCATGGSRADLAAYMVGTGTSTEGAYPYTASDSACNAAIPTPHDAIAWDYVSDETPTVAELKDALCTYGPIATGIWATPTFQAYSSGIFNEAVTNTSSNHAITLVGWSNQNGGYWIVKNSWDTDWGENGYGRVAWGSNNVGRWANWIRAPWRALQISPDKWREIWKQRKIPVINRYIKLRQGAR